MVPGKPPVKLLLLAVLLVCSSQKHRAATGPEEQSRWHAMGQAWGSCEVLGRERGYGQHKDCGQRSKVNKGWS